jgi:hypothetical protein
MAIYLEMLWPLEFGREVVSSLPFAGDSCCIWALINYKLVDYSYRISELCLYIILPTRITNMISLLLPFPLVLPVLHRSSETQTSLTAPTQAKCQCLRVSYLTDVYVEHEENRDERPSRYTGTSTLLNVRILYAFGLKAMDLHVNRGQRLFTYNL